MVLEYKAVQVIVYVVFNTFVRFNLYKNNTKIVNNVIWVKQYIKILFGVWEKLRYKY